MQVLPIMKLTTSRPECSMQKCLTLLHKCPNT
uniref:Uncharacterized protein n=1 Tax=Rhizophora mucronata TaxID=61149 RepID=A0A2P2QR55_RHIMU